MNQGIGLAEVGYKFDIGSISEIKGMTCKCTWLKTKRNEFVLGIPIGGIEDIRWNDRHISTAKLLRLEAMLNHLLD